MYINCMITVLLGVLRILTFLNKLCFYGKRRCYWTFGVICDSAFYPRKPVSARSFPRRSFPHRAFPPQFFPARSFPRLSFPR